MTTSAASPFGWIEEPWMCRPVHVDEIPDLRVFIYHPAGGPWGYITVGCSSTGRTIAYGSVKDCHARVADLKARIADPAYAGPGQAQPLFPEVGR